MSVKDVESLLSKIDGLHKEAAGSPDPGNGGSGGTGGNGGSGGSGGSGGAAPKDTAGDNTVDSAFTDILKSPETLSTIVGILGGGALGYGLTKEKKNTLRNILLGAIGGGAAGYFTPTAARGVAGLFQGGDEEGKGDEDNKDTGTA